MLWRTSQIVKRTISRQLTWRITGVMVLLLFGVCSWMIYWDNQHLKQHAVNHARAIADVLSQHFVKIVLMDSMESATDTVDALNHLDDVLNAYLYNTDGEVVFSFTRAGVERIPPPQLDQTEKTAFNAQFLHLVLPLSYQETPFATLYIRLSTRDIDALLTQHMIRYSLLFPMVAALSLLLASWLQRTISKPILHLSDLIGRVSREKDFSLRAYSWEKNEIATLFSGFNELLETVQLANKMSADAEHKLMQAHDQLEHRVIERTEALHESQHQLIQSEKMAALGGLVAGVAHEINTPVGIGVTAASHLSDEMDTLEQQFSDNTLSKSQLHEFLTSGREMCDVLLKNMRRASDLVKSFKQVAVDQSCGEERSFYLKEYIREILLSLHPKIKKTKHKINLICADSIKITNYPGALSQIVTNLITNSLIHGFRYKVEGTITIDIMQENQDIHLRYQDDGVGIPKLNIMKIYEPFYTTNRMAGSTGLGMHIVSGLVLNTLRGSITCESDADHGVEFLIDFPMNLGSDAQEGCAKQNRQTE